MHFDGTIIITDPCYISGTLPEERQGEIWDLFAKNAPPRTKKVRRDSEIENQEWLISLYKDTRNVFVKADPGPDPYLERMERRLRNIKKRPYRLVSDNQKAVYNFLGPLGFTDCIMGSTLYGDWSCTVYNIDTKETIGKFCADGGMYCVMYLDEVLNYAPKFNNHEKFPHSATVIENFNGDITPKIVTRDEDASVIIVGKGNINFTTAQTGF